MSKLNFLLILIVFFFSNSAAAQEFEKAPLPKVKTITEWIQPAKNQKVKKGRTYYFSKNGKLTKYEEKASNGYAGELGFFQYDERNRIKSKEIKYGNNNSITNYGYAKNYFVELRKLKDTRYKDFFYSDKKNRLSEKKSFLANYDTEYKYQLFERITYQYDAKGKLKSEKHFNHWNVRNKRAKPDVKKTTYEYFPKTNRLKKIKEYDYAGQLNNVTTFKYNSKGKKTEKILDFLNGKKEVTKYAYQKGKLWTEIFDEGNLVITKIYKKNRLIRKRKKWHGGKEEIIDFQYVFY